MDRITTIGFDADDTLWHNERFFRMTQEHFAGLLADYTERETLMARLLNAERRNLARYGYGIKGFMLSMIETAIEVTEGRVPASIISDILNAGQEMLRHPIDFLPHAEESIRALAPSHHLVLITKGDLLDQERKLAQSGLGDLFDAIEIVSEKTPDTYARIFARHGDGAERALMAGNSMKSDVVAPIMAGAWGVHVPHGLEWEMEKADTPFAHDRFRALRHLGELPDLVGWIDGC
ncbi:MAG: HAD family hydrolase [Rhodobacteraceae bacterium]|nr:HAD family hydrolase [Paracoccaceae bacterium]